MKKKVLSLILAVAMIVSLVAVGVVPAAAEEEAELTPGKYPTDHGTYTPSQPDKIVTQHLMFAMPGAWQNDITKDPKCNGVAGMYWWTGWDKCENQVSWSNAWPGYKCDKVEEEGVENLYSIDMPNFGNGEEGNGTMIIWNNFIDGGTETDPDKNPFREAAQQSRDFQAGYYSRNDRNDTYEPLFRYIYKYNLEKFEVPGAKDLDLSSETFWKDINRVSAAYLGYDYDNMDADDRAIVVDEIMDDNEIDFSVFGEKYASNFFNSDFASEVFPNEEDGEGCIAFHFDNMVFVVNLDPSKMQKSPLSQKIGFDGEFYFYYGGGNYGSWPTEELNEEMGGVKGNFATGDYVTKTYEQIMEEYEKAHKDDPTTPPTETKGEDKDGSSNGSDVSTKAGAATLNSASNSNGVTTNGSAVQTGSVVFAVAFLTVLVMVAGIVWFARKKKFD